MTSSAQETGTAVAGATESVSPSRKPPLDLRSHLAALRRFWRSILAVALMSLAVAATLSYATKPTYETRVTFFVSASVSATNTPLQADEYAQRRVNSYVGVVDSERMAQVVITNTGLSLQPSDIMRMTSASVQPDTVLLNVRVTSGSAQESLVVARSIAANLDGVIARLDGSGTRGAVNLRVLSGPTLNPDPVAPRKKLNLALGLLIGLGLGVAQALVRLQLDRSVRGREQLVEATGLPALGVLHLESSAKSSPVLVPRSSRSPLAEGFRQLRTNLRFVDAASPVEVLVVTSSVEREGKTSTAANLAQSFAESGRRVLLVDADLRKPKLGQYLDLEEAAGLTDVLIGEVSLADVAQMWGPDGLAVLTSGPVPPNPSELLGSPAMEKFVREARNEYELVIIDTPPLLPVTDGAVTSVLADGVLLLVRYGRTRLEQVQQSIDTLSSVDARVLGSVLTMAVAGQRNPLPTYESAPVRQRRRPRAAG